MERLFPWHIVGGSDQKKVAAWIVRKHASYFFVYAFAIGLGASLAVKLVGLVL